MELLQGVGFSADQASKFLPVAASGILSSFERKDIEEIISAFGSKDPSLLLSAVNVDAIAKKTNISSDMVTTGLEAISPVLSQAFTHSSDGMVGAAISIAWDSKRDFVSTAKKDFW